MDTYYLILVIVLFILAIADLVVGVSNDAVNFLNSAIGSKAAPFKVIMVIASLGILFGATFSNGMMEVARKGIMNPDMFVFSEIIIIFVAVMITDILLLDLFNSLGLPTSTTVSIVFELLGASVAIAIIKATGGDTSINEYINTAKALAIISGILLSVGVAFSIGALVQYISRTVFTFKYEKYVQYFGSIYSGMAIAIITYFILIKGAKGASFMTLEFKEYIKTHAMLILGMSFIAWTVVFQILISIFKVNVFKVVVLVGTFALAMAFAGNDLVNFIGVPLAGFESFKEYISSGQEANELVMTSLTKPVSTPTIYLIVAGLIMAITLWTSKKAKAVVATTINLSTQEESTEQFESNGVARGLVRVAVSSSKKINAITPVPIKNWVSKRFDTAPFDERAKKDGVAFDLVRASVNLVVASILIAIGTSLKLPLSTTYVTFMVAMGTSLADQAWGRETATYRISGVLTVILGWFVTAMSAFTVALIVAMALHFGGPIAFTLIILFVMYTVYKSTFKKKKDDNEDAEQEDTEDSNVTIFDASNKKIKKAFVQLTEKYFLTLSVIADEDYKKCKKVRKDIQQLDDKIKGYKDKSFGVLSNLSDDSEELWISYVQLMDYMREASHNLSYLMQPIYKHLDNNHKPITPAQAELLGTISEATAELFTLSISILENKEFDKLDELLEKQKSALSTIKSKSKEHIKLIKKGEVSTRNSQLFMVIVNESKNLIFNLVNVIKSERDFCGEYNN